MTLSTPSTLLSPASIDVWTFALDVPSAETARLDSLLSLEERDRGDRFARAEDARRYRCAHARVRELLAFYLAVPPQRIVFSQGTHGKPIVSKPETDIRFNLSHSDALAAVAVASDAEIGVDIEHVQSLHSLAELESALSTREQMELATFEGAERIEAFYRCWTRKEALLKGIGQGLSIPLESFDVPVTGNPDVIVSFDGLPMGQSRTWRIVSFEPAPGFVGAVAIAADPSGRGAEFKWRTWPEAADGPASSNKILQPRDAE